MLFHQPSARTPRLPKNKKNPVSWIFVSTRRKNLSKNLSENTPITKPTPKVDKKKELPIS
jgi:hypothetical protein